jgi:hypothetical protein
VVPPSGNINNVNIPAKKNGAPSAHTIMLAGKDWKDFQSCCALLLVVLMGCCTNADMFKGTNADMFKGTNADTVFKRTNAENL